MPQLNGGGGDDLGANDEMIAFKDEGEQEEKISENSSAERDLADVKSSLVNESETNQNSSSDSEVSYRLAQGKKRDRHTHGSIIVPPVCVKFNRPKVCYTVALIDLKRKLTITLIAPLC